MQELLNKFREYVDKMISKKLGNKIAEYLGKFNLDQTHDFDEIEHDIKLIISTYLASCSQSDFEQLSNTLYDNYIEYDDNKLISSVRFFIRIYSKFEDMKIKRLFYKWRINTKRSACTNHAGSLQGNSNFKSKEETVVIDNTNLKSPRVTSSPLISTYRVNSQRMNNNISPSQYNNSIDQFISNDKILSSECTSGRGIFERLYSDSIRKQDEKLLNYELKRLSELETCTFQPNVYKKK
jgi:hypothetical protein